MADKQPQLNGAYYGPAIPPPQQQTYRRRRGCGSCGGCLFSFLWKLILAIIILGGLAILIFWIIVQPRHFKFYVTEANLTQFDYSTTNNTLYYNLALNITVRNPNKKLSFYHDRNEARAFYGGHRFSTYDVTTHLNSFRQYDKSSSALKAEFKGKQLVFLNNDEVEEFNRQKSAGVYDIDVKFYMRIRFRLGDFITGDYKPNVKCGLEVPFSANGTSPATVFETKRCRVRF
ncbi:Late embryogenesis abundant protein [Quillaja saponaria]|uniref:Late embryogenesis abundant protein n=1 Tax=Quillaja saponaria TaxID=32244 RepID=A0AAD7PYQ4_QUISA|nr:Late embryogenesis abundant protein [Quillaja saponaria]